MHSIIAAGLFIYMHSVIAGRLGNYIANTDEIPINTIAIDI